MMFTILATDYEPGVTFMVAQKRHKTRLFPDDPKQGVGRMGNVPPGTVVDTEITNPTEESFFLASHEGIQVRFRLLPNFSSVCFPTELFSRLNLQLSGHDQAHRLPQALGRQQPELRQHPAPHLLPVPPLRTVREVRLLPGAHLLCPPGRLENPI